MARYRRRLGNSTFKPLDSLDLGNLQSDEFEQINLIQGVVVWVETALMVVICLTVLLMLLAGDEVALGLGWILVLATQGALLAFVSTAFREVELVREETLYGVTGTTIDRFRRLCEVVDGDMLAIGAELIGSHAIEAFEGIMAKQGFVLPVQIRDGERDLLRTKKVVSRVKGESYGS